MKTFIAAGLILFLSGIAYAGDDQIFLWTDENGETQASQKRPEGWQDREYKKIGLDRIYLPPDQGSVKKTEAESLRNGADPVHCRHKAERHIPYPEGTTRMSSRQRAFAEKRYERDKQDYINKCMGREPKKRDLIYQPSPDAIADPGELYDPETGESFPLSPGDKFQK